MQAIVDICRQLDGLPLAIALAAGRVPRLGVEGVRRSGRNLMDAGHADDALAWLHGGLSLPDRNGDSRQRRFIHLNILVALHAAGRLDDTAAAVDAARLLGSHAADCTSRGEPPCWPDRQLLAEAEGLVQAAHGTAALAAWRDEGALLDEDGAMALALSA